MRGAACGTNGTLLVTDDGGLNWDYAVAQGTNTFTDLDYYDVNTFVAVDASGKVFVLTGGGVEITQPGEGEVFQSGETKPIEFSASPDVTSVAIRLSTDGGATWSDVETAWPRPVGNPVTYDWTIPSSPSDACLVEVANANDSSQSDQSDVFTITSHATTDFLQVAYPNGGEALAVGSTVDISWTHSGFTSLDILFSTDDFASDETTLFSNVAASNGSISWTVPDAVSNQCRIKIVDSNEPFVFDESDNVFSIERTSSGSVELLAPRGHQWWVEGKTYDIRWSASDISLLSIDLTTDAGSTWSEIATNVPAADGAYTWTVPTGMRSSECLIRVEDASDASIYDISQGYFIIGKDTTFLDLFHPNGGEQFSQEGAIYVEWRSANVDSIIAQHSTDLGATWQAIAPKLWADRIVFPWEAPDPTNAFESHLVRIFDHDDFNVADTSERPFVIYQGSPPLELVYPEGGEFFGGGETVNVSWNFNGIDYVDIFFSSDGLGSWRPLAQRVDATGTPYAVQLPELYSADCYIHVVDADRYWIIDRNDMPFTVEGIGAPNVDSAMQNLRGDVSSATLAWSAVNGADSYYLQLARDAAFNDLVLNIQLAETSFDVSGLESGSEYFWRVAAIVQGQQGAWTPAYRLTASLVAPKGLSAAMTSPGSVLLQWEDLTTVESAYIVERRNVNTGEDFAEIFSVAADITKVGDAVDDTSSFVYRVFAVNENTRSDYSNEAAVVKGTLTGGLLDDEHVYFYPNPINPEAGVGTFRFSLSRSADVTITIYDVEGLEVNTLDVGFREEGIELSYEWDCRTSSGRMVDNGTYFYVIETNADERGVGKLSVVR